MKTPLRLVWSEGMFLSPQHLQSLDRYHEQLLEGRVQALAPYAWGVLALDVDRAALGAGQLRLERFAGVFPAGLAVGFGGNDPEAPPPRPVAEHFPAQARTLEVHLGVPRERDGLAAYGPEGTDAVATRTRYTIAPRPVQDATQPGATAAVPFARPNLALLLGAEPRDDFETMKIAELVRTPAGQLAVSEAWVPPLLRLGASPWLAGELRALLARLIAKHRELAASRRHRDGANVEVGGADIVRFLQLSILGAAIPELALVTEGEGAAPVEAYRVVARLAGQLASFSADADVAALPRYAHAEPRPGFEAVLARIQEFVGGIGVERFVRVPLEVRGPVQLARFPDDKLLRGRLFLVVKTELPEPQVAEQLPRLCKIAALPDVQALVQAAAPGLPLQYLNPPPPELPARAGTLCFALGTGNDRLWKNVLLDRTVAMYLPPPFDPARAKVELLAVPAP
jgi:type VI secretion system protein ImpJ